MLNHQVFYLDTVLTVQTYQELDEQETVNKFNHPEAVTAGTQSYPLR